MSSAPENIEDKKSGRRVLMILILALIALNLFLLFRFYGEKKEKVVVQEELVSTQGLKEELQKQLKEYDKMILKYKGKIIAKDSTLVAYQKEVENQKAMLMDLTSEKKITRAKYEKALEEIERLKYYSKQYQDQINDLMDQNKELTHENVKLKKTIKQNKKNIDSLEDKTTHLSNKLSLGAKLSVDKIEVKGLTMKAGNKKKETLKGDKMDGLMIAFTMKDNLMADKGNYEVYVKIINPKGETLYMEGYGSGKFDYQGEQSLYSVKTTIEFKNETGKQFSIYWSKGSNFEKGNYKVELYANGQLLGDQKFVVK